MAKGSSSSEHRIVGASAAAQPVSRPGLDGLLEGCQIVGFDYTYLYVNDALVRQSRRRRDELLGRTMMEVYPGIEEAPFFDRLRECLRERRPQRLDNEFRFPDGSVGWFELRMEPVPEGVLVLSIDVSELRASELRYRRLLESAPIGIFVQTRGRFAYVNPQAARLFGFAAGEEMLDRSVLERFAPELRAAVLERIRRLNELREPVESVEEVIVRADGSHAPVEVSAVPVRFNGDDGALVFVADTSERHRAAAEQVRLEAQFHRAQKMEAIGRLAGGIAHDFNNLISVVLGSAELARAAEAAGQSATANLAEIQRAAESAAGLTRQLLAFGRRQVMTPVTLDLNAEIRRMEPLVARLLGEDIALELRLAALGRVAADPSQIEQVVMNLAVNSRDAMPDGGRLIVETADVELDDAYAEQHVGVSPGPYVMLAVCDDGCGMDAATRERLFEPFFTTKEAGSGTGLGLATVYGIVRQSRGSIWVYSEPGQGAAFRIYLPQSEGDLAPSPPPTRPGPARGGTEPVLLVEDQPALREIFTRILAAAGYAVRSAGDAREALRVVEEEGFAPSLVVTDVVLPGIDGPALVGRLRARFPELRVLFMSGYSEESVARHGPLSPLTGFIGKPFPAAELARRVRAVLDA